MATRGGAPVQRRKTTASGRRAPAPAVDDDDDGGALPARRKTTASGRRAPAPAVDDDDWEEHDDVEDEPDDVEDEPGVVEGEVLDRKPNTSELVNASVTIEFEGIQRTRTFEIRFPSEVQLAMWRRLSAEHAGVDPGSTIPMEQAVEMSGAVISIIQSLLVNQTDRRWIELQLLNGDVELTEMMPLVDEGLAELRRVNGMGDGGNGNRAARRAAGRRRASAVADY